MSSSQSKRMSAVALTILALAVVPGAIAASPQSPAPRSQAARPVPPLAEGPDYIEIVDGSGARSRVAFAVIKRASSGPILRNGDKFEFTPLLTVMQAAKIPASATVRVGGTAHSKAGKEMVLAPGGTFVPGDFGFIFNRRGRPVLTPRPGTKAAASAVTSERPQVVDVTTITVVAK